MSNVPADLRYAKSHEWVRREGEIATVGISDHAQHELTDVVFVELPALGRQVRAGEPCGIIESVKTASDLYAPLTGEVLETNTAVANNAGLVNSEPYGKGWLFKLRLSAPEEWDQLLSSETYRAQIGEPA